ncbi:MAG TPA: sigma-70 family RNA polymerase sigma factor [Propionibacteriaceae bacterium]|nr:sigma-70 family RNA polymerase sigma factor [Propionibacteriaceae bacterium]
MPIIWGELAAEPLLTPEEEISLALQIEAGLLARDASERFVETGHATAAELATLQRQGEQARQRYIAANLRLVASVSAPAAARSGLPQVDLFQEGCLGLIQAVERFDCRRGHRFSTYALFWIRAYVGSATASRLGAMNLPPGRAERLRAARGAESELAQLLGRPATTEELAVHLGRPARWVADLMAHQAPQPLDSIEMFAVEVVDQRADDVPALPDLKPLSDQLLSRLPPLERDVLCTRLGFVGREHSYVDTARLLSISVTRVRRLEARALERLRGICPQAASALL